jgi:regulator of sigma E protease
MSSLLFTLVSFVVALGVLISVHEFGHFWVARTLGVKVLRFSIGFGKPLWRHRLRHDGTEFVISVLPLGGYVKMLDEREGEVATEDLPRAFNRQPLGSRAAIVAAGPVFNFLFAVLAYWLVFIAGDVGTRPIVGKVREGSPAAAAGFQTGDELLAVDGRTTPTWETVVFVVLDDAVDRGIASTRVRTQDGDEQARTLDFGNAEGLLDGGRILSKLGITPWRPSLPPVIDSTVPGGSAEQAGLRAGDRILSADGQEIADWEHWVEYVRARPGRTISVRAERDDVALSLELVPATVETDAGNIGRIGARVRVPVGFGEELRAEVRYGPLQALGRALEETWRVSRLMLKVLGKMIIGQASVQNLSGPITIAQYAGESASIGASSFLKFLAIVSISLGVLNLLPIPVLDGGHLLYYLIELAKGSPVSERSQLAAQKVGLIVLLALIGLAFYLDLERLLG